MAQHLGYNANQIKKFSKQTNPCLCLLNEYFSSRSAQDATLGILSAVKTMECSDAELVVTKANQVVGKIFIPHNSVSLLFEVHSQIVHLCNTGLVLVLPIWLECDT